MRIRTTLAASAVVGLALLIGGVGLLGVLRRSLEDNVATAGRLRAADVVGLLESGASPNELSVETDPDGDKETTVIQVVDASGTVRLASSNIDGKPPVAQLASGESRRVKGVGISPEDPYLVVAEVTKPIDGERFTVLVARALEPTDETMTRVLRVLLVGLPLLLVLVALTTWTVVGRALRPVAAITSEVRSITDAELDRRVPEPPGDDEIGHLARTMNAMLARLQRARDRQRQFVSDASHELRSPIATIRHQLEVALAHPETADLPTLANDLLDEDLRMQRVVDDLLVLARSDERDDTLSRHAVDLDDLAVAEAHRLRTEGRVRVDAASVHAARVAGDPTALSQVVRNLVDNAARHASGRVSIAVAVDGDDAVLLVEDDGPGIPAADRDRVFERFTRLDDARSRTSGGAGLGLAIVAQVVEAHGGTVTCGDAPGGGARFEVRLPAIDVV
jgi:signal transduction histidine kinase